MALYASNQLLPLNTPFLATIPIGEAEEIIKRFSPASYIIPDESPEKVAFAITDALNKYKHGKMENNHVIEFLEIFSSEKLMGKMISIIENKFIDN